MSHFSERSPKFQTSITDRLRAAWTRLPWPSPGKGEPDPGGNFRSYGSEVTRVSQGEPSMFRDYGAILPAVDVLGDHLDLESAQGLDIPFAVEPTPANSIRTAVSIPLYGPIVLQSWEGRFEVTAGTANPTFSIFVGETADGPNNVRPPGDCVLEFSALSAGVTAPASRDGLILPPQTEAIMVERSISRRVNLARFFLKFSIATTTVGAGTNPNVVGILRALHWGPDRVGGSRAIRRQPSL